MTDTDTTPDLDGNVKFEGKYCILYLFMAWHRKLFPAEPRFILFGKHWRSRSAQSDQDKSKEKGNDQETRDTIWESDKTQGNITQKGDKGPALSSWWNTVFHSDSSVGNDFKCKKYNTQQKTI